MRVNRKPFGRLPMRRAFRIFFVAFFCLTLQTVHTHTKKITSVTFFYVIPFLNVAHSFCFLNWMCVCVYVRRFLFFCSYLSKDRKRCEVILQHFWLTSAKDHYDWKVFPRRCSNKMKTVNKRKTKKTTKIKKWHHSYLLRKIFSVFHFFFFLFADSFWHLTLFFCQLKTFPVSFRRISFSTFYFWFEAEHFYSLLIFLLLSIMSFTF